MAFTDQTPVEFDFFGYRLLAPSAHPIIVYSTPDQGQFQPYREIGLARTVQAVSNAGSTGVVLDIGANIGDSLAVICRHSHLHVICVEASDFFAGYLRQNVDRFFLDRATVVQAFVTSQRGGAPQGLAHWGGTAKPVASPFTEHCGAFAIQDLVAQAGEIALLKIDTDGYDLDIIRGAFEAGDVGQPRFPIYFEFEITETEDAAVRSLADNGVAFFEHMAEVGYGRAFIWDDPGRFYGMIDLSEPAYIRNAINYMTHLRHRPVWGFDICLIGRQDAHLADRLAAIISGDLMLPLAGR
jgi:FkbM family methyltransferase